ncbi:MAG: hypothetical protein M1830_005362 [Pleopsidium flavum]|nr:MAG: hypothetical protein M1830_005362 [Pleopsidium flavum]
MRAKEKGRQARKTAQGRATYLNCGEGADAIEARAESPGSERNAEEDWVEVDDGLEMSLPSGGSGDGALSSADGAVVKAGRSRTCCDDGGRNVGSMGDAR